MTTKVSDAEVLRFEELSLESAEHALKGIKLFAGNWGTVAPDLEGGNLQQYAQDEVDTIKKRIKTLKKKIRSNK